MHRFRLMPVVALVSALMLVLAACANDSGASSAAEQESEAESHAATSTEESADEGGGDADTVVISGFDFGDDITVAAGTTVTFQNDDDAEHSVTNGTDGEAAADAAFDEDVEAGESVEIPFDEPGTYDVTCRYHPTMQMTVTVE